MYGLNQVAIVAYKPYNVTQIYSRLDYGHTKQDLFCLCVENFGVKYFSKDDVDHFLNSLGKHYSIANDLEGRTYPILVIEWNYREGYFNILM